MSFPDHPVKLAYYLYDPFIGDIILKSSFTPDQVKNLNRSLVEKGDDYEWMLLKDIPPWAADSEKLSKL